MESRASRLKAARRDAGYTSVRAACDAFGYHYPTYAGHENGARDYDFDTAQRYAKAYKVDVTWLMTGRASADTDKAEVIDIWTRIPERDRAAALRMLRGLTKKAD
jgi:transcriptional regulator with XRE-family HTH domain